ncbi:hypothetical protein L249_8912 [Ophiocordyceps polyrhachis-furcata BCC 54312]|uniref:Uncharacterized protein n=1 Tax=Ophiocordyceps polyrhachis-furcata BCC 54312 TaxID=1330021 RepID=A0A367L1X2_9HYPO|nr:hypothetical protein L249_8912 [Ophiocordyceps polyrhachis-furcata BCC 54312]
MTEARTEGKPSARKRRRHGAMGPREANRRMSHARAEAKLEASGEKLTGDEDASPDSQLIPSKEEAKIERQSSEPSLANRQDGPQRYENRVRRGDGLERSGEAPRQHQGGHEDVGGDEAPEEGEPFACHVGKRIMSPRRELDRVIVIILASSMLSFFFFFFVITVI